MKFQVTYYDYDADEVVTKNCYTFSWDSTGKTFSFIPVDDIIKMYKSVVIDHPVVTISQREDDICISARGYQHMRSGGYYKTETVIKNIKED